MNNVTIPPERGFPFELVAESQYGYKWIKWITKIEVSDNANYLGYWESRGYRTTPPSDKTEKYSQAKLICIRVDNKISEPTKCFVPLAANKIRTMFCFVHSAEKRCLRKVYRFPQLNLLIRQSEPEPQRATSQKSEYRLPQ